MPLSAPLRVTVEISLGSGSAAGQRRFRLSQRLEQQARLFFDVALPIENEGIGKARFWLPNGHLIEADARLYCDPERPGLGSHMDLLGLSGENQQALAQYLEERLGEAE